MVQFASYLRRVLHKTRLIFPRINGPIVYSFSIGYICLIARVRYIKILSWLRGFLVIFLYLVWFSMLNSLMGIARQRSREKIAILTPKHRSHVWILGYCLHYLWTMDTSWLLPPSRIQACPLPSTWTCPPSQYLSTPNCKNHRLLCSPLINMVEIWKWNEKMIKTTFIATPREAVL